MKLMLKTGRSFGKKETIENTLVKLRKSELRKKKKKGGSLETIRLLKEKARPNRDWGQQSNGRRSTGWRKGDDRC
jgi:hypothetical protein